MSNQSPDRSLDQRVARLQGDLQNFVQVLVQGLKRQLSPYDVDAVEYTVLSICLSVGSTSIRNLRELVPLDYGHLSRTTSGLEDKGLLQKIRIGDDRRVVSLRVTEEGASLIPELMARAQEYYVLLVRDISREELVGSMAVMQKMISGSEEGESHPAQAEGPPGPSAEGAEAESPSIEALIGMLQGDLMKLVTIMYQGIEERVSPFGFAVGEFSVLAACFSNESITISGLAEHVPFDVGRISRLVSRLEDRGLVWKARPERDRRVVRVEMTDEGRALAVECMRRVGEHYANVVSGVSEEELIDLMAFIETMRENAEGAKG